MKPIIKMVDLHGQYLGIKEEVDVAMQQVIDSSGFINGHAVGEFATQLADYTGAGYVIPCANGTDALQIAYMALELQQGDEILMPSFNYVASAETAALLKLKPVFVDVHPETFNMNEQLLEEKITEKTRAIVVVHLFGQMVNMTPVLELAEKYGLWVIEDSAQALGAEYAFESGEKVKSGSVGHINTTSFFPTKNLGCFGDGGAILTDDPELGRKCTMLTRHGQQSKYMYETIGCNSRLDTIQAAILKVKLLYLDKFASARQEAARVYDDLLSDIPGIEIPARSSYSSHVYHQYVIKINEDRDGVKKSLENFGIPTMIYYPCPLHLQNAYQYLGFTKGMFPVSEKLCDQVLALPMHTELTRAELEYICTKLKEVV